MHEDDKAPFTDHLEELRKRIITCFIAVAVGFVITYSFKEMLFQILTRPLVSIMAKGDHLVYTGLPEAFFTYLKVSFLASLMLSAPVIFYEFWMFIAPGLYKQERKLLLPIVLLSSVFFVGGALFGYFIVFPFGFKFFLSFATETIRPPVHEGISRLFRQTVACFRPCFRASVNYYLSGAPWDRIRRISQ